ncbi:MAG: serine hydrolase [Flavisolibacter sp.]
MKKIILFICYAFFCLATYAQLPSFITDSLEGYITQGLKDWDLPGLAITIVKDDKVIFAKGYGVRNVVTKTAVDTHTLFMIASNTKLFTASALSLLETQGKLSLNDPITKYFPDYRLFDSTASRLVTLRDLLSHRIGTKTFQGDFTFWNTALSRKEIMYRMRLLKPALVFRQDYGYCNSCFLTAGEVIPKVTGKQWEDFVLDHFIGPLKMKETMVLSTGVAGKENVATPYTTVFTGKLLPVPYDNWNNLAPAASIISNVEDLSHWLLMQLDSGRYEGKQVLPWAAIRSTRDMNTIIGSRKSTLYPSHFRGYGLGLFMSDYNGRQLFWHTGGAGGMVSNVSFVPEEKLGIAILTNNDNQEFFEALRYQVLDAFLGVPFVNRSLQRLGPFRQGMKQQLDTIAALKKRLNNVPPELPLSAYLGVYSNELYGKIKILQQGKTLKIVFDTKPDLSAVLEYLDSGEWLMRYNNIEYGIFKISFDIKNSKVVSLTTRQNDFVEYDPYVFIKN